MTNQPKRRKMLYCEPCSYKQIIECEDEIDLFEIKSSDIQRNIPRLNPATKRPEEKPKFKQAKRYKCPKCGRGIVLKDLQGSYAMTYKQIDQRLEKERIEEDRRKRIEDGKPPEKVKDDDIKSNNS